MGITAVDESKHEPTDESNWQENYLFLAWDDVREVGLYMHLGHLPAAGVVDARVIVRMNGCTVSAAQEFGVPECLAVPWIDANIISPLDRWKLRVATTGVRHEAGTEWFASTGTTGDVDFGFEIDFESVLPPVDWGDAWEQLGLTNIMSNHYDAACRWQGTVWVGPDKLECSGLMLRDHSWGPRNLKKGFQLGWWIPVIYDDCKSFVTGASVLQDGSWSGFLLEERGDGPKLISTDPVVRANGLEVPKGYESGTVLHARDGGPERIHTYQGRAAFPVFYETMGSNRLYDLLCRVTTPDGRTGFGNLELNFPT